MTVARSGRPPTRLEIAKQHVERAFGPRVAKRLDMHRDGTLYVTAGGWALLLSWLVDFVVVVLGMGVGFVAAVIAYPDVPDDVGLLITIGLLVGVPMLYGGLCYRNGRALGAVLTGTRIVRVKNGRRLGATAWWGMFARTVLFPPWLILFPVFVIAAMFEQVDLSLRSRISIDPGVTRQLHAAGFLRLDAPSLLPR
jgi:hypothetical protein